MSRPVDSVRVFPIPFLSNMKRVFFSYSRDYVFYLIFARANDIAKS